MAFYVVGFADLKQTDTNFGLIDRNYPATNGVSSKLTQWQKFSIQLDALNAAAPSDTVYKLFLLGRHGEGYHNAAEDLLVHIHLSCLPD